MMPLESNEDSISKITQDLEATKTVLHDSIDKMLERGEKIDKMVEKSQDPEFGTWCSGVRRY